MVLLHKKDFAYRYKKSKVRELVIIYKKTANEFVNVELHWDIRVSAFGLEQERKRKKSINIYNFSNIVLPLQDKCTSNLNMSQSHI